MSSNDKKYFQISDVYPYLKHPEKYTGKRPITVRSSWEASFIFKYLDINENILEWGSESVVVYYTKPSDGRLHRYFIDFNFKAKTKDGSIKQFFVEIKPQNQIETPKNNGKKTKKFHDQVNTFVINQAKWQSAKLLAEQLTNSGIPTEFLVISEKDCPWFVK